ncbi:hypothetical protein Tco_0766077 [Tanacetum coccineum]
MNSMESEVRDEGGDLGDGFGVEDGSGVGEDEGVGEGEDVILEGEGEDSAASNIEGNKGTSCPENPLIPRLDRFFRI